MGLRVLREWKKRREAAEKKQLFLAPQKALWLNVLLPLKEEIVVNKIFTFSEESVLVYIHKKNAVFIELEKEKLFIPTVYTLWKLPEVGQAPSEVVCTEIV